MKYVWRNGEMIPWGEATLHVASHALMYGTSLFEGIRSYKNAKGIAILALKEHLRRFFFSAKVYKIKMRYSMEELERACVETLLKNELDNAYIRPMLYVGDTGGAVDIIHTHYEPETAILALPWRGASSAGEGDALKAFTSSWRRPASNTAPAMAKSASNYMLSQLMVLEGVSHNAGMPIALNGDGIVSEGAGQNVFFVRDGVVYTPDSASSILHGITRDIVVEKAKDMGFEVLERALPREWFYWADEIFVCGTATEIKAVVEVDGRQVGDGKAGIVTQKITDAYKSIIEGEDGGRYLTYL